MKEEEVKITLFPSREILRALSYPLRVGWSPIATPRT
jgi:hypothetical protein